MEFLRRTWAEISESALIHNFEQIKKNADGAAVCAVVKADAYGHSAAIVAPVLEKNGADFFAVSNIEEALSLRIGGIKKPILILGYTPANYVETLAENDISQCVYSPEYARLLSDYANMADVKIKVHLKIDTGMSRIGFDFREDGAGDIDGLIKTAKMSEFDIEGVFTHFAVADSEAKENTDFTQKQFKRFNSAVEKLKEAGVSPRLIHCDNSAAICRLKYQGDMVRPGIILYGLSPDRDFNTQLDLIPVMTLKSVVSFVKTVKTGTQISYGRTFTAKSNMKIATVSAGYADGYPRKLSNKGEVIVCGKRAKVVGRVCMDQIMIDVTGIEDVKIGDEVTLFGKDLSVDSIARICDTINYEIICDISPRVPRVPVK